MKNILIIGLFLLAGCSSPKIFVNNLQIAAFVADGQAKEWGGDVNYDPKTRLIYKLSNDDNNLYVMLKVSDEQTQRRMLMSGLTVWVDTSGRKNKKFGITFPRGKSPMADFNGNEPPQRGEGAVSMKDRLQENLLELETFFYGYSEPHVMYVGESKIRPVIDMDSARSFIYECSIPIGYFLKNTNSSGPLSIGFIIGSRSKMTGLRSPNEGEGGVSEGGAPGGGMGRGMGGGRAGGGSGGGMPGGGGMRGGDAERQGNFAEPVELWVRDYVLKPANVKK